MPQDPQLAYGILRQGQSRFVGSNVKAENAAVRGVFLSVDGVNEVLPSHNSTYPLGAIMKSPD